MRPRTKLAAAVLVIAGVACAPTPPQQVFRAYRAAVQRGDVAAAASLEARSLRVDPRRQTLDPDSGLWSAAQERLGGKIRAVRQYVEVALTSGATVTLTLEDGRWRVASPASGLWGTDTPEAALQTLADAVAFDDLAALRTVIPSAMQKMFTTDESLRRYVDRIRDRVAVAIERIGPVRPGLATIRGEEASITYGGQRRVRFLREANQWRVLDVE